MAALAAQAEWLRGQVETQQRTIADITALLGAEQQARLQSEQVRGALEARLLGMLPASAGETPAAPGGLRVSWVWVVAAAVAVGGAVWAVAHFGPWQL